MVWEKPRKGRKRNVAANSEKKGNTVKDALLFLT
jgi:hypothetical protein